MRNESFFILMDRVRNFKFFKDIESQIYYEGLSIEEIYNDKTKAKYFYDRWYSEIIDSTKNKYEVTCVENNWESLCKILKKNLDDVPLFECMKGFNPAALPHNAGPKAGGEAPSLPHPAVIPYPHSNSLKKCLNEFQEIKKLNF